MAIRSGSNNPDKSVMVAPRNQNALAAKQRQDPAARLADPEWQDDSVVRESDQVEFVARPSKVSNQPSI